MRNIWVISDTHFGDEKFYTYKLDDGTPARYFKNYIDADIYMVDKWNSVVKPEDKVYMLGDLGEKRVLKYVLPSLNGTKVLIKGNHDRDKISFYKEYFKDIRAYHHIDNILMAHIPVHPNCKGKFKIQVHGHTHAFCIKDNFYYNVCVENHDYTPVHFDIIKEYAEKYKQNIEENNNIWDWCYKE